jgi:integrase
MNGYLVGICVEFTPNRVAIHGKTCATLRLANGAPTEVVRRLLGHSTDRVLRHYVALTDKQQAELLEQTSPLSHTTKRKRR